jgi:sulfate adenylyltransferase subunit 2
MKSATLLETLRAKTADGYWHDLTQLQIEVAELEKSKRQLQRNLEEIAGPVISSLEGVIDARNRPLNRIVLPHLRNWLKSKRLKVRVLQINSAASLLILSDLRGHLQIMKLSAITPKALEMALNLLTEKLQLVPHGEVQRLLSGVKLNKNLEVLDAAHLPLEFEPIDRPKKTFADQAHLWELEQESIHIIREAVAAAERPAMLFSLGKDSMVMLRLAEKAFAPEAIPFVLVNIDTRWKFQEMNEFREWTKNRTDVQTIHYINPDAIEQDINPFDSGSATHTDITKTQALKQILEEHEFDFVFGGARRDEEKSRAKERIFSVRDKNHAWDPRNQRPELWNIYNTSLAEGQSIRVFPISNWTELDIWRYLEIENVPMVPLYFAKRRPFVKRNGALIMIDDDRFRLDQEEKVYFEKIRFRSLGCYPLSGGVLSDAETIPEIIQELISTRVSERSSRVIDFDRGASMEQKKKEGYF